MACQIRTVLAHYPVSRVVPDRRGDDAEDECCCRRDSPAHDWWDVDHPQGVCISPAAARHTMPEGVLGIGSSASEGSCASAPEMSAPTSSSATGKSILLILRGRCSRTAPRRGALGSGVRSGMWGGAAGCAFFLIFLRFVCLDFRS